jgi:D-sedoheptulose 7-phosphate isomerase
VKALETPLTEAVETLLDLRGHTVALDATARAVVKALQAGHKLLVCGNGGSAAEAMHLVTELIGRYGSSRRSLPALFLGGDASAVTCIANDFSWEETFARPLSSLGQRGDVLVCFSTSGNSPNVLRALQVARDRRITTVALLGKDGGKCRGLADHEILVRSRDTARIQEAHLFILHWLCDCIEEAFA